MANITGNNSANTLNGTAYADTIKGLGGSDKIYAKGGNDSVWGGLGNDSIYGDAGNDSIYGNEGDDVILGGLGNDSLYGDAGTDTLRGEDGNDVIKGGSGKSFLYGGNGDDTVFYDPTTSEISAVGSYLSGSVLKGDAGNDTLNVYNSAKYYASEHYGPSMTDAYVGDNGVLNLRFTNGSMTAEDAKFINVGTATGFETVKFHGAGGVNFSADLYGNAPTKVEGTAVADIFFGGYGNDTFTGGLGNDEFNMGGGNDTIISGASDADSFHFGSWGTGTTTIKGFNGAGSSAGDKLYLDQYYLSNPAKQVVASGGNTTFTLDTGEKIIVQGVTGLIEGVDWFV